MAEYYYNEEVVVKRNEPIIFENNTDSDFDVSAGIIFRKSGIYQVYVGDGRTVISKVENSFKPMKGKWTKENACEFCGFHPWYEFDIHTLSFYPNCGADMRERQHEID